MSNRKRCICRGKAFHLLTGPFFARMSLRVKEDMAQGASADFTQVKLTLKLVQALADDKTWPFETRFDKYDHHLSECPCSPRFQGETAATPPGRQPLDG